MSNISSVNNYYADIFKTGSLSRTDAGTAELLSNVFKAKSSYDYQSQDGDSLSLSSSGKGKQVMDDLMYTMQMMQGNSNVTQGQVNASALSQTTTVTVQSISFQITSVQVGSRQSASQSMLQMSDSVKQFMEEHRPEDLRRMSPDQIPDDVKSFTKEVATLKIGAHHQRVHAHHRYQAMDGTSNPENPNDAA